MLIAAKTMRIKNLEKILVGSMSKEKILAQWNETTILRWQD